MNAETGGQNPTLKGDRRPKPGRWVLIAGLVGLLPFVLYSTFAGVLPYMEGFRSGDRSYWIGFAINAMLLQWITFGAFLFCLRRGEVALSDIGFPVMWKRWQVSLIVTVTVLLVAGAVLVASAQIERTDAVPVIVPETLRDRIVMILLLAPTAAIVEEAIFRGFALTYLPHLFGGRVWVAVIASALLFSLIHADWREPGLTGIFNFGHRFVFALIFSGLFLWRRSLKLPISLHWFVNGSSALTP